MLSERIQVALKEASETREVVIGSGAIGQTAAVFRRGFGDVPAMVVADDNTFQAAGRSVHANLVGGGVEVAEPFVFPGTPVLHPDFERVLELEAAIRVRDMIPVAVGSGVINDLTRLAAHRAGRAYLVVATAASMDGYTAFAAAITHKGVKRSDDCPAPRALVADLDVLANAPAKMTASGYGDLLAKFIAGADWMLAEALGAEALDHKAWALVGPNLARWTGEPGLLRTGDRGAFEGLIEGLVLSGLAMQAARSSRPAAGAEHLFSHLWEMRGVNKDGESASHGFKVGLGTLAAAGLYDLVLQQDPSSLDIEVLCERWPSPAEVDQAVRRAHPDPEQAEAATRLSLAKHLRRDQLAGRLSLLRERWPELRPQLRAWLPRAEEVRAQLRAAGCPVDPEAIGLSRDALRESYLLARQIRTRYTVLDLAAETEWLEPCLEALFRSGGLWGPAGG